ncbi:MAG TPA: hypothetical protein VK619_18275 [Pyrinomonadaceae bacterium]|nr:hypothetical protein [Pyrinomonadaceae bacterium]
MHLSVILSLFNLVEHGQDFLTPTVLSSSAQCPSNALDERGSL